MLASPIRHKMTWYLQYNTIRYNHKFALKNWHTKTKMNGTVLLQTELTVASRAKWLHHFENSSFSLMANSFLYGSIAVSITWRHCRRSAARRQAEWTPVLKGWTSRDTILNHVSRGRPLGLLHSAGGLLTAATTTPWWSFSYDLLAR